MGYYTDHALKIIIEEDENKYTKKDIIIHLRGEYEEAMAALDEDGNTANEAKWYKSDDDMLEFSTKYPNILFILSGEGQDFEDKWKCYFKNGKSKKIFAEIDFPRFSPEKLVHGSMVKVTEHTTGTSYCIEFFDDDGEVDDEISFELIEDMRKSYKGAEYALDEDGNFIDQKEWFHHQANLLDFSQKYPQILFVVRNEPSECQGEEKVVATTWRKYFQNGKLQISEAYWDFQNFNEEMLQ